MCVWNHQWSDILDRGDEQRVTRGVGFRIQVVGELAINGDQADWCNVSSTAAPGNEDGGVTLPS